jgi:hypothetical protein
MMRLWIVAVVVAAVPSWAGGPDALQLMREADQRHRLAHERVQMAMTLEEKGGSKRVRTLEVATSQELSKPFGDKQWIRFDTPGDVKDTQLLTIESAAGVNDQWLYLPAFSKTRRLGAADLGERFAGTDMFFEDLKRRLVDDYAYKMLGPATLDGADCWHIESVPQSAKTKAESPYARTELWLRKDNLVIIRIDYFDKQLKPLKRLTATSLVKVSGTAWRADQQLMVDVQRNHKTTVLVTSRDKAAIPADTFNSAALTTH